MAELDDRQKTESPTQKRLDEARRRGQVPRSRDLSAAAVVLAAGIGCRLLGAGVGGQLLDMMRTSLRFSRTEAFASQGMGEALMRAGLQGANALLPLLACLLVAAVAAPLALGGWNFSAEAFRPNWARLDPVAGLRRVFSMHGALELGKALARVAVVGLAAVLLLRLQFGSYAALGTGSIRPAIGGALALCGYALLVFGAALAGIAAIDVPLTLWQHHRQLRMSRDEIREEHKDTEGSPENRARVRRAQQELARKRMMEEVPRADVVVTNPTHYAVALRYDERRMRAPVVVAKGADLVAQAIRELATRHGVPLVEAPPLARALHGSCALGDEIPARLYAAVAQLLTYVYQLRQARRSGDRPPPVPHIDAPPPEKA